MDTGQMRVEILLFIISIFGLFSSGNAASAHIHSHQHNKLSSNERTEDGAFSPRGMDHYAGGEHHEEFDHEAILGILNFAFLGFVTYCTKDKSQTIKLSFVFSIGSVKEAEEFDKLPIKESKRRLEILLTKMDLNNDRFIEKNELKAWILRSFRYE